ncbi:MAG: hypothetical protein ACOCXP_03725 [Candidatus Dojkabacteria bacterium]
MPVERLHRIDNDSHSNMMNIPLEMISDYREQKLLDSDTGSYSHLTHAAMVNRLAGIEKTAIYYHLLSNTIFLYNSILDNEVDNAQAGINATKVGVFFFAFNTTIALMPDFSNIPTNSLPEHFHNLYKEIHNIHKFLTSFTTDTVHKEDSKKMIDFANSYRANLEHSPRVLSSLETLGQYFEV